MVNCIICGKKNIKGKYPFKQGFRCHKCRTHQTNEIIPELEEQRKGD